jgi:hypothetical protein
MSGLPALRCFIFFAADLFILVYPSFNIHRLSWPSQMGQMATGLVSHLRFRYASGSAYFRSTA